MGHFQPSGRLLVFHKCMVGQYLVSEVDFWRNTRVGIQDHNFSLECIVSTKVECNVVQTLHCRLVGGSAHYIAQNHSYGGKFKTRSRFYYLCYSIKCTHTLRSSDWSSQGALLVNSCCPIVWKVSIKPDLQMCCANLLETRDHVWNDGTHLVSCMENYNSARP